MNMNVRAKRGKSSNWQRRSRGAGHAGEYSGAGGESATAQQPVAPELRDPSRSRSRQAGPSQDTAVYNCECGYVFEEHVSTTVGCPHCGQAQAW